MQVTDGVFTVPLDFGLSPFVTGTAFTLEIGVRPGNSNGAFTALAPRQPISSSPYAIQTINAQRLGGVPADQYVKTDDPRLTNGLPPAPGSNNYIQNNPASQQAGGFNVSGNGALGGALQAAEVRAQTGPGFYGLTHTDGATTVSTYVGGSSSGASGGWLGTGTASNIALTVTTTTPNEIAVKIARTDIPNHSGEGIYRSVMVVVY